MKRLPHGNFNSINIICSNCGKEFWQEPNRILRSKTHCCSVECRKLLKAAKLPKCPCGNDARTKYSSYCSDDCRNKYQSEKFQSTRSTPEYQQKWKKVMEKRSSSPEWREKQKLGSQARSKDPEYLAKLAQGIKERSDSPEWWEKMQSNPMWQRGEKNPCYTGHAKRRRNDHKRLEYKQWRKAVFERDGYTCQSCLVRGGVLHAHHIKEWAKHPELRYEASNGQTLCKACHSGVHKRPLCNGKGLARKYELEDSSDSTQLELLF